MTDGYYGPFDEVRHVKPWPLTLDAYQSGAVGTAFYPGKGGTLGLSYVALKMNGEAGEFAEHLGKAIRDDQYGQQVHRSVLRSDGVGPELQPMPLTPDRRELLKKELGDVLWYVAAGAAELGFTLEEIAQANLDKLAGRKTRGTLGGSGDDR